MREVNAYATGAPNLPQKGMRVRLAPFAVMESLAGMMLKFGLHEGAEGVVRHCYGRWPLGAPLSPGGSRPEAPPDAIELHLQDDTGAVTVHLRPYTPEGIASITLLMPEETP